MEERKTAGRFSPEVRERAVRLVRDHEESYGSQWAAMCSIAGKIGCSPETLRNWVRQAERDAGERAGQTCDETARIKELERENRKLKEAREILRKASAFFLAGGARRRSTPGGRSSAAWRSRTLGSCARSRRRTRS